MTEFRRLEMLEAGSLLSDGLAKVSGKGRIRYDYRLITLTSYPRPLHSQQEPDQ